MLMQIVTLLELATLLKVSRATIYRRVKAKEIRSLKRTRSNQVLRFDLEAVMKELRR